MTSRALHLAADLRLPLDTVTSTIVVYGGKGMGKTNLGSVLVEEMTKAGLRWAVLDPLGVWWGLRHSADGKAPGIECLILGGDHGDLPLEPTAGAVVADLVVQEDTNVVIDFSRKASGEMWSVGEKIRFVTEYALRLFQRQGELVGGRRREPIMQVLDEAARYIPQVIPHGAFDLARCVGAWEQISEEGRNVGLGVTFLTQRSARMNKSVSELAEAMIAFRIVGPRSIEAVMDWLGEHVVKERRKDLVEQLRRLPVGQALVVSPGWLGLEQVVHVRMRETFDSSATPKPGERRRQPGRAAKPDLEKYRERMAESIEKAKAEDPRELKRRIQELEKERRIAAATPIPPAPAAKARVERVEVPVRLAADLTRVEKLLGQATAGEERVLAARADVVRALQDIRGRLADLPMPGGLAQLAPPGTPVSVRTVAAPARVPLPAAARAPRPVTATGGFQPNAAQQRMLNTLTWLESIGVTQADRAQLAFLAKMKPTGGYFQNMIGNLQSNGAVTYPAPGRVRLTDVGRALSTLEDGDVPRSSAELQAQVLGMVTAIQRRILEQVIRAYPGSIAREALAEQIGAQATGGYFQNMLGALRTLGMVTYPGPGEVAAAPVLFLEGR